MHYRTCQGIKSEATHVTEDASSPFPKRRRKDSYDGLFQPIARPRLSQEARQQLLERIADGRLPPETRVYEADLARQLGVSRTPLHEAMVALERDRLVQSLGRRGWRITSLRESEAREIYPVLGVLEPLVVTLASPSILGAVDQLRELGIRASAGLGVVERLQVEKQWHTLLLGQSSNRTLNEMIRAVTVRVHRFELDCARRGWSAPSGEIVSATESLANGDYRLAARSLEMHWRERGESIVAFVRQHTRTSEDGDEPKPAPVPGAA
jgi:DNA-binding GntR family transcriptional regulator